VENLDVGETHGFCDLGDGKAAIKKSADTAEAVWKEATGETDLRGMSLNKTIFDLYQAIDSKNGGEVVVVSVKLRSAFRSFSSFVSFHFLVQQDS